MTADTNLVHARINHYYTVAMGRADVDLDCLYSAFIRVCSLYTAGMKSIYTEAVNEKPLERGKGHFAQFSFEGKTYMAAMSQDDDGKEFDQSLTAAYQNAVNNKLGLWLRVLRDRKRYELEINTQCIVDFLQKFYEEELDKKYK